MDKGWTSYVDGSGTHISVVDMHGVRHRHKGTREITAKGEVVHQFEDRRGRRVYTVWEREGEYQFVLPNGRRGPKFTTKPGDPENL